MPTPPTAIAIIPARGGSRRIPRKNIRELAGKPLIAYTIAAALESGLFARTVVSTDDPEIAGIATRYGADVPFLREPSLSDDVAPVSAATVDALKRIDASGDTFASVCQLMANCPLRTARDVIDSYRQFSTSTSMSQISVVRYGWQNPWWAMRRDGAGVLEPLFPQAMTTRSQDLPDLFCPTGAVWWARSAALRSHGTFHIAGRTGWEIPWQQGIDIDTEDDWAMTELLIRMPGNR